MNKDIALDDNINRQHTYKIKTIKENTEGL